MCELQLRIRLPSRRPPHHSQDIEIRPRYCILFHPPFLALIARSPPPSPSFPPSSPPPPSLPFPSSLPSPLSSLLPPPSSLLPPPSSLLPPPSSLLPPPSLVFLYKIILFQFLFYFCLYYIFVYFSCTDRGWSFTKGAGAQNKNPRGAFIARR